MHIFPKKTKYSAYRKARCVGRSEVKYSEPMLGVCALKCLESGRLGSAELRAVREFARKLFKRYGKSWVVVFPDRSISKKPGDSRMGKGKGGHFEWVCLVKPGRVLLEVQVYGLPLNKANKLLRKVQDKLSIKTTVVIRKY